MDVLSASSAVSAVHFLSCPQKRASSKRVFTMCNLKIRSIKRRASNKIKVEKLRWVSSVRGRSVRTVMASLIWGLTEKAAIALEPIGRFEVEGPINDVAAFLDKYPFFAFGVSFVVFFVIPLLRDEADKSMKWITAEEAYSKLRDETESHLVDIRTEDEIDNAGSPDMSTFNMDLVQETFKGDEIAFLIEMRNRFKQPANTTLYILDAYDGNSMQVAQMLTRNGFKASYAIRDGFQGSNGWQAVEEKLFTKSTQYGAGVSPNPKINAVATSTVKKESLQDRSTESKTIPSSMNPEVRNNLAPQPAPVMPDKKFNVSTPVPSSFDRDDGVNSAFQAAEVEVSSEATSLPRALSPYPQYPDLKPPTSPTPSKPIGKTMDSEVGTNLAPQPAPVMPDKKFNVSTPVPSFLDRDAGVNLAFQAAEVEVSSEATSLPRALSPYPQYPDLKPPTSPTPSKPIGKTIDSEVRTNLAPQPAPVISDRKFVGVSLASQAAPVEDSSQAPSLPRSLSPYSQYPDLKPPTSPTPSKPIGKTVDAATNDGAAMKDAKYPDLKPPASPTPSKPTGQALDFTTNNGPVISDQIGSDQITKSTVLSSSEQPPIEAAFETPCFSGPLSPYAQYPDLKPPTSPTPSKPSLVKATDSASGRIPLIMDQNVDETAPTTKPASLSASLDRESEVNSVS